MKKYTRFLKSWWFVIIMVALLIVLCIIFFNKREPVQQIYPVVATSPVEVEDVNNHKMHSEFYTMSKETADILNKAKRMVC